MLAGGGVAGRAAARECVGAATGGSLVCGVEVRASLALMALAMSQMFTAMVLAR